MDKKPLFVVAILSLVVQATFPMWWGIFILSIWLFFIEGIVELGLFNSGYWATYTNPFLSFFWIYGLLAIYSSIASLRFYKRNSLEEIYSSKKWIFFLIVNVLTIVISITLVLANGGFIPRI